MHATPKPAVATTVAVDLAKDVFELAYADALGRIVARRCLGRAAFAGAFDNHTPLHIVMEACGSAHHWARRFQRQGHAVTLLPAHDVRPYVHRISGLRPQYSTPLLAIPCRWSPYTIG